MELSLQNIALILSIISLVLVLYVFHKKPIRPKHEH